MATMPARHIEIKARIESVEALLPRARALANGPPQTIAQDAASSPAGTETLCV